jgi:hypothetical protein
VFDVGLLVLVQVDLDDLVAVQLDSNALSDTLGGENQVIEHRVVYSSQRSAADHKLCLATR